MRTLFKLTVLSTLVALLSLMLPAGVALADEKDGDDGKKEKEEVVVIKEHKLKGVKEDKVKKSDGSISIQSVNWTTGSNVRRISKLYGVYADDESFTQARCSGCWVEVTDVRGTIWKNGAAQFTCSVSQMNVELAKCDTVDVGTDGGANFRGTGKHSYRVWGQNDTFLPDTDTGWHWVQ
jgi:hypothetical protein